MVPVAMRCVRGRVQRSQMYVPCGLGLAESRGAWEKVHKSSEEVALALVLSVGVMLTLC